MMMVNIVDSHDDDDNNVDDDESVNLDQS